MTVDLRMNEPRYPSLPNIQRAKRKPFDTKTPADLGIDVSPRLEILKTVGASRAQVGRNRKIRRRACGQAQDRNGVGIMTVLLIAELNGSSLSADLTAKALTAAQELGDVTVLCAGAGCAGAAQRGRIF